MQLSVLAEFTVLRLENIALKILYELTAERHAQKPATLHSEEPALADPRPAQIKPGAAAAEPDLIWIPTQNRRPQRSRRCC